MKEGRDGAHLITPVQPFQTLGLACISSIIAVIFLCIGDKFAHIMGVYTVTACWYSTYLGKGSHLSFLNRSEDRIDKLASNIIK